MLAWHNMTMAAHGRALARDVRTLGRSLTAGEASMWTMAIVVAVAFLREGAEVVLFLYGVALSNRDGAGPMMAGIAGGVLGGAGVVFVIFRGLLVIPARHLIAVINGLLAALAAGMAGQAAAILASVALVPTFGDQAWDTSGFLRDDSIPGRVLRALVGYSDRPPVIQVVVFLVTLALFVGATRLAQPSRKQLPVASI